MQRVLSRTSRIGAARVRRLYSAPARTVIVKPRLVDDIVGEKMMKQEDTVTFQDSIISEVLLKKQGPATVHFVQEDDFVLKAIRMMSEHRIGAVLVRNQDGNVVGIFTERDYLNKMILKGNTSASTRIYEVMTTHLYCVGDNTSVLKCMHLMTTHKFRHLPVVNLNNELLGVLSIGDLVKSVIDQYKETVTFLREFIERSY